MTLMINKNKWANRLLAIFLALVVLAKVLHILPFIYLGIVIAAAAICLGDDNFRVGTCLLLVPNIRMFDGTTVSFFVNLLITMPVFLHVLETRRINFMALCHVVMLAVWELAHVFYLNNFDNIAPNLGAVLVLYYIECVLTDRNVKVYFPDIVRKFSFGCLYSAVVHYIALAVKSSPKEAWDYVMAWRLQGFAGDPNYFALYLCIAASMMLIIGDLHKKRDYVYILLLMLAILLTFSKMSLVILLLNVLYFSGKTLYNLFSRRNRFVRRITIICIAAGAVFSSQIVDMINVTLVRLQEHNGTAVTMDTITSNRARILQFYSNELINHPALLFFGYGLQYNKTPAYTEFFYVAHNTFLDLMLSWGAVGVAMFIFIFYHIFSGIKRSRTHRFRFDEFLPLIITCTSFLALSCLSASMFWWIICAALLPLKGMQPNESAAYLGNRAGLQHGKIRLRVRRVAN